MSQPSDSNSHLLSWFLWSDRIQLLLVRCPLSGPPQVVRLLAASPSADLVAGLLEVALAVMPPLAVVPPLILAMLGLAMFQRFCRPLCQYVQIQLLHLPLGQVALALVLVR